MRGLYVHHVEFSSDIPDQSHPPSIVKVRGKMHTTFHTCHSGPVMIVKLYFLITGPMSAASSMDLQGTADFQGLGLIFIVTYERFTVRPASWGVDTRRDATMSSWLRQHVLIIDKSRVEKRHGRVAECPCNSRRNIGHRHSYLILSAAAKLHICQVFF